MTTSSDLNPAENVIMMKEMEEYCLQLIIYRNKTKM